VAAGDLIETDVPFRLDRLTWGRFHTLVVVALGITWILDGLEVTIVGAISGALQASPRLHLTDSQVGASASFYLAGAVVGALLFGWLTDALGRRRLFFITLGLYVCATAATALAPNFLWFAACRFLTGSGIGGEYTAINSAIQELIPARYRGRTDLAINGSFWLGALLGSAGSALLLVPGRFPPDIGWRLAFGIGAGLGLIVLFFRRSLPESPRWLVTHGRTREADATVADIERRALREGSTIAAAAAGGASARLRLRVRAHTTSLIDLSVTLVRRYPKRALLGLALMSSQAFFYNGIFFTFALVLGRLYHVPPAHVGWYLIPFSISNFAGPLATGWLFDRWGRKPMIIATNAIAGVLIAITALAFANGLLTATLLTLALTLASFFASPAASAAYLTVGESFPLEVRALSIALFYAFGTGLGGVAAPWIFGALVETGRPGAIAWGYALGAAVMCAAAVVEACVGVAAERQPLESVAQPLSSA
jgi:MFS family permease